MEYTDEMKVLQEMHRVKLQEKRDKIQERKNRTRRLIQRGAIIEAAMPETVHLSNEEFQKELYKALGR